MMVSEEYQLLYCPVPLVATGPWLKVFYQLGPGRTQADLSSVVPSELANRDNFIFLSSFPAEEQARKVSTYLRFMVTRHPFLRVAAAYKMKFATENKFFHEHYGKEIVQRYRPGVGDTATGDDVTFLEFVEYLVDLKEEESNEHWEPLDSLCHPCEVNYDFILHYETVEEDARELLVEAKLIDLVPSLPTDAWDHISPQYAHSLFRDVTPAWLGRLVQLYREDFSLFSYASLF